MKKPIIFSVLFFIITSISSFGQGGGDPAFNILAEEIGKNRALINSPIIFETDEASMSWRGEISKNKVGELDALDLDLSMRLKISENIPWYAAIFGGVTALASGVVIENIFEDTIENASTINFQVFGNIDKPNIKRLD